MKKVKGQSEGLRINKTHSPRDKKLRKAEEMVAS